MLTLMGLLLFKCLYLEARLFGDHVCQTEIIEPEEILQWELKNRTIRTYKWCMNVPPRCSVYSHKVFNETIISVINTTKSIERCCEGFYEQSSYCISMCQDCKNGLCLKGTCICQSGWDGQNCGSRSLGSNEEFVITTIQTPSSSTINYTDFSTILNSKELQFNITSKTTQISSGEDIFVTKNEVSSTPNFITSIVSNTDSKESTLSSSTNLDSSPFLTSARDYKITTISQFDTEEMVNSVKEITFDTTSPKYSVEFSEESGYINYTNNESKVSEEEFTGQYSTDHRFFDTIATRQSIVKASVSTDNREIVPDSKIPKKTTSYRFNFTYPYTTSTMTTPDTGSKYLKNHTFLDTTATKQNIETTSISRNSKEIDFSSSKEMSKETSGNQLDISYYDNINTTTPLVDAKNPANYIPVTILENPDLDVDYRELGGQSVEDDKSMESPKVLQNGMDKNHINLYVPKTTRNYNSFQKDLDHTEEIGTITILENITPVLDKPNIIKDEKENSIFKDNVGDSLDDLTEERYEKRSSNKNYSHNTLLTKNEADNNNLIYSVCAASATTVLILIVAIVVFTLRSARKKLDKNKEKKDVATVAVYATSIFHSPLPDPPTFENPTYLSTTVGNDNNWNKEPNEEMIEVQEFNVVFQKTLKNPKIDDCKQYLYDHPPSTGSYRASSEVDTLSQYNLSHKSLSGIILEPVYDEIPSRDIPVNKNDYHEVSNRNSMVDTPKNHLSYIDNNSLYVNTFGRTKF